MQFFYPCILEKDHIHNEYILQCDRPEAFGYGETPEAAKEDMKEALLDMVNPSYIAKGIEFPLPEQMYPEGFVLVGIGANATLKILLLNMMVSHNIRQAELARLLNIPRQHVSRLLNPRWGSSIDLIDRAFDVIGAELIFSIKESKEYALDI